MGRRGIPKGYRFKPEAEVCRNRIWVKVTDEQYAFLEDMVVEHDISFAHALRICVEIVGDMPLSEYQSAVRKRLWKK